MSASWRGVRARLTHVPMLPVATNVENWARTLCEALFSNLFIWASCKSARSPARRCTMFQPPNWCAVIRESDKTLMKWWRLSWTIRKKQGSTLARGPSKTCRKLVPSDHKSPVMPSIALLWRDCVRIPARSAASPGTLLRLTYTICRTDCSPIEASLECPRVSVVDVCYGSEINLREYRMHPHLTKRSDLKSGFGTLIKSANVAFEPKAFVPGELW